MSIALCKQKFQEYSDELNDLKDLDASEMLRFLIRCGEKLQGLSAEELIPENYVSGCISNAYIVVESRLERACIRGNSDAMVVRGFIAVLADCCAFLTIAELSTDGYTFIDEFLHTLDLDIVLTPARSNAFGNVVLLIINKAHGLIV